MIHKAAHVPGHVGKFIPEQGFVAETCAAIIEKHHCEPFRQRLNEVERPRARAKTIAHDEDKGWTGATDIESDLDAVNLGVAHRHRATSQWDLFLQLVCTIGLAPLFHSEPACSRIMNFWMLPVEVLVGGPL